ncbi:MAG TPA: hypothetical protein VK845_17085 [Gemmatimonadales bacterium]|nr:hypothetical protein [Gemmatimonadales bacterium]
MARRGLRGNTRVAFNKQALDALDEAIYLGLYDAAVEGKHKMLDHANSRFKTIRRFTRNAFAAGFDETGDRFNAEGKAPDGIDYRDKGMPVAYFGYQWFVARFYETGTARQSPRPSAAPAAAEITSELPQHLRKSAKRRGF